jgi:hypothetical protein
MKALVSGSGLRSPGFLELRAPLRQRREQTVSRP